MHPIQRLRDLGQSVWLDFIERSMLTSGALERMIERDGLAGQTTNPTIFQKSIASSHEYDALIRSAAADEPDDSIFRRLAARDVTLACDLFRPLYERTRGMHGLVSIEVDPRLAADKTASIEEARRLWHLVSRPNVMIKIPGTGEGVDAIRQCLSEGININITLLFSVPRYREVIEAYLEALEARVERKEPIDSIASVASFFVSRVDTKLDKVFDRMRDGGDGDAARLRGQIAIANARIAYEEYERVCGSDRWLFLASRGARPQRLLWASTSTKDPAYPDTYYAEELVGKDTIDTMTPETFDAYADHGRPEVRLTRDRTRAHAQMGALASLGIDFRRTARELEDEGVQAFSDSYRKALGTIGEKRRALESA
jgi:transaldolase